MALDLASHASPDRSNGIRPQPEDRDRDLSPFATASQVGSAPTSPSRFGLGLGTSQFPFRRPDEVIHEEAEDGTASRAGPGSMTVEVGRGTRNGVPSPRGTTSPASTSPRSGTASAAGRGTTAFSIASSSPAPTPTAYESRSLLGILNPHAGPSRTPATTFGPTSNDAGLASPTASNAASPSRRRKGLSPRRNRLHTGNDEEDEEEDEEGPPESLMIDMGSLDADALPLEARSLAPEARPRGRRRPSQEAARATSRSRSPSPSITRHVESQSGGVSGPPFSKKRTTSHSKSPASTREDDDLAEYYPAPSVDRDDPGDEDEDEGEDGVQASTAFLSGAQGRRRAPHRRGPPAPRFDAGRRGPQTFADAGLGLLARAKKAWDQERTAWSPDRQGPVHLPDDEPEPAAEDPSSTPLPSHRSPERRPRWLDSRRRKVGTARERALYRWVNVTDLDGYLQEVYAYYVGQGIYVIGLNQLVILLTTGFVIWFSVFVFGCIDYSILRTSHHLSTVVVPHCVARFSGLTLIIVLVFGVYYAIWVVRFGHGIVRLLQMREFFTEVLEIPEHEIQTVPWHRVVDRLSTLRASHPSRLAASPNTSHLPPVSSAASSTATAAGGQHPHPAAGGGTTGDARLDAHDVANRIMREDNYLIALFNNPSVLDLRPTLPPWVNSALGMQEGHMSRTLEWNMRFAVGILLDEKGQVRNEVLVAGNRKDLAARLKARFLGLACLNAIAAPFIVPSLLMYSFLRYFEEYHGNPSSIGSRGYTQLARWKFREFNELNHLFKARLDNSYEVAKEYVDRFPKAKTAILARFVAFVAGSFAAVLILLSIFDPDAFLHFEITDDRSVLFYIGLFGGILAVARGMIPEDHSSVDPADLMQAIALQTHYLPASWRGKLHSVEVHKEFSTLFQMKVVIFVQELLSVVVTPYMLWKVLPDRSAAIIDFFREHTVHVDGLGHICSYAAFDFTRQVNPQGQFNEATQPPNPNPGHAIVQGKMEKSLLSFQAHHPNWEPSNQAASLYLSRMTDMQSFAPTGGNRARHVGGIGRGGSLIGRSKFWGPASNIRGLPGHQSGMTSTMALGRAPPGMAGTQGMPSMQRSAYVNGAATATALAPPVPRIGRSAVGLRHFGRPDLGVEAIDEEEPQGTVPNEWSESVSQGRQSPRRDSSVEGREEEQDPFGTKPPSTSDGGNKAGEPGVGALLGEVWQQGVGKW